MLQTKLVGEGDGPPGGGSQPFLSKVREDIQGSGECVARRVPRGGLRSIEKLAISNDLSIFAILQLVLICYKYQFSVCKFVMLYLFCMNN